MFLKISSRIGFIAYTTLLASIAFSITGQLLMKWTMLNSVESLFTWSFFQQLILAVGLYSLGVVNWIIALRFIKLSVAYPLTSLNYIGILLGSYYFFNEEIPPIRLVGVFFVFVGVLLVALPQKKHRKA